MKITLFRSYFFSSLVNHTLIRKYKLSITGVIVAPDFGVMLPCLHDLGQTHLIPSCANKTDIRNECNTLFLGLFHLDLISPSLFPLGV